MRGRRRARQTRRERARHEVLRAFRLALKVPAEGVAEVAKVAPSTLSAYETGRRRLTRDAEVRIHNALTWFLDLAMTAADAAEDAGLTTPAPRLRRVS